MRQRKNTDWVHELYAARRVRDHGTEAPQADIELSQAAGLITFTPNDTDGWSPTTTPLFTEYSERLAASEDDSAYAYVTVRYSEHSTYETWAYEVRGLGWIDDATLGWIKYEDVIDVHHGDPVIEVAWYTGKDGSTEFKFHFANRDEAWIGDCDYKSTRAILDALNDFNFRTNVDLTTQYLYHGCIVALTHAGPTRWW